MNDLRTWPVWDAHVECQGYVDAPLTGEKSGPYVAALASMHRAGVVGARQFGVPAEVLYWSRVGPPPAVALSLGGAYLDGSLDGFRLTRVCRDADAVQRSLRAFEIERFEWTICGRRLAPALRERVLRTAAEHGMACALEAPAGGTSWPQDCPPRSVESLLGVVGSPDDADLPLWQQVARLGEADPPRLQDRLVPLVEAQVPLVPLLLRVRRATVLEDAIAAPGLQELCAILPYHRHLLELRNPAALRFGRRHANRYLGFTSLGRAERLRFERGWDALLALLVSFAGAGGVLAGGSGAPATGLCPGIAVFEEARLWLDAGVPVELVRTAFCATARELAAPTIVVSAA